MPDIDAYPPFLNTPIELVVDERIVHTRITANEWLDYWRPLLQKMAQIQFDAKKRIMIAIGGPPGAGKSVFAAQLHWLIGRNIIRGCHSVALPMDGYHYDNVHLRENHRTTPEGAKIPLSQFKGAPDTYDIAGLKKNLLAVRAAEGDVRWPAYSRELHDVIPGKHHVQPSRTIIFVEGNYMLVDRGPFKGLPAIFDLRIYIDSPAAVIISTLMNRHITSGKDELIAKEWVKKIDLPNARLAESTKPMADVIIERNSEGDMVGLIWKEAKVPVA